MRQPNLIGMVFLTLAAAIVAAGCGPAGGSAEPRQEKHAMSNHDDTRSTHPTAAENTQTTPPAPASADPDAAGADLISIRVFNDAGQLVGPIRAPRVKLTEAQWRSRLTDEQFRILRRQGTEQPFCGTLLDNKKEGVYACAGCRLPLFASDSKFNSRTGWPSFFRPIADENVTEVPDHAHGMVRTEILCARCDGHLGHVFEDGPRPTGLRYCLNSEALVFAESHELATLADPAARASASAQPEAKSEAAAAAPAPATAVLAGGCFWCTEAVFEQLDGVLAVVSGYAGDTEDTARYELVSTGRTRHAEAIRITYDPTRISYDKLLQIFFTVAHDPTQLNRQGNDVGPHYRSAVFYADEAQKQAAQRMIQHLQDEGRVKGRIVTTLERLDGFYEAEAYHQDYAARNPDQPYIRQVAQPKVDKLREKHPDRLRTDDAAR